MFIVLIAHGKGSDRADSFAVKLFESKDFAEKYIAKVTDTESKYWTVAELIDDSQAVEPAREGFYPAGSSDWL